MSQQQLPEREDSDERAQEKNDRQQQPVNELPGCNDFQRHRL